MPLLLESGDRLLLESGDFLDVQDESGIVVVSGAAASLITVSSTAAATVERPRALMPAGVHAPDDFTDTAGTVLDDCTATTGWETSDVVSVVTTYGFPTVHGNVFINASNNYLYVNLPADVSTVGWSRGLLRLRWQRSSAFIDTPTLTGYYTINVASGMDLGGAVVSAPFPATAEAEFVDVVVDVGTLTQVRSIGIRSDGGLTSGLTAFTTFDIAEIRFANETALDRALEDGDKTAVIVAPGYEPTLAQDPRTPDPGRVLVDLRSGSRHIGGLNGVRHLYEWGSPVDGVDATDLLQRATSGVPNGATLLFPAGRHIRLDGTWYVRDKRGVTIDLNGSTVYTTRFRGGDNNHPDPMISFQEVDDVTFRDARVVGYHDRVINGADLFDDGGAPTISGTAKLLDAQDEGVRCNNSNAQVPFYARQVAAMLPADVQALVAGYDPGYEFGHVYTATLSDTAQTAGDCMFELVDDGDLTVLASRTVTLTATPTKYVLTYRPADLRRRFRVRVRKATSAANTITVASTQEFGIVRYESTHDSASAIGGSYIRGLTFEDVHVEGAATDAWDFPNENTERVTLRRVVSRGCSRQGMSFNWGRNFTLEDFEVGECGRSGIDIEPYQAAWYVDGISIRHGRIFNAKNYAFACQNWQRISRFDVSDVEAVGCGIGLIIGGGVDASFVNVRSAQDPAGSMLALFRGIRMRVSGVTHVGPLVLGDEPAGQYDNQASDITVRGDDLIVRAGWTAVNARGAV